MLNNIHDSFFKRTFSVKENLQDLIQGTLPREVISKLHPETLKYDPTEYVDPQRDRENCTGGIEALCSPFRLCVV